MTTVALLGKIDIENFGDLLLARVFVDWIKPFGLRVICPNVPETIVHQIGADAAGSFKESDFILYIGGGYFGEQPGTFRQRIAWGNGKLKATILPGLLAMLKRKPVAIIGPGYGPISNPATRLASIVLFRYAKVRSLRDSESVAYFRRYGGGDWIEETADCVLTLTGAELSQQAQAEKAYWRGVTGEKKLIGVHLTKQAMDHAGGDLILQQVRELGNNPAYQLIFFNDQKDTVGARATDMQNSALAEAPAKSIEYTTIDKLIGLLDACDLVITSKLHVGIVAAARSKPVVALPYHSKTERFYRQIGRPDLCLPYTAWTKPEIQKMFEKIPHLVNTTLSLPADLVNRAQRNRALVESFVKIHAGAASDLRRETAQSS